MTPENSIELARDDGVEFRSLRLGIRPGGAIVLDAQDVGSNVRRTWDDGDYEFGVRVPAPALSKLAFELLKDRFTGAIFRLGAWLA